MSGQDQSRPARSGEPEPSRDTAIGIMALVVSLACLVGIVLVILAGGWWLWLPVVLVPLGITCAYGVTESFQKVPRDAKGNRIK